MKKRFFLPLLLGIGLGVSFGFNSALKVEAADVESDINEVIPSEEMPQEDASQEKNEEENVSVSSIANQLIDEYFGWVVGIPVGTVISGASGVLICIDRLKKIRKTSDETKSKLEEITENVNVAKESLIESKNTTVIVTNAIKNLNSRITGLEGTLAPLIADLEKSEIATNGLIKRVENLQSIMAIEVKSNPENIKNGAASEVANILVAQRDGEFQVDGVQELVDSIKAVEEN